MEGGVQKISSADQSKSSDQKPPKYRIPAEFNGINVNFCKSPTCDNFGTPATNEFEQGRGAVNPT
jgi:hypothetical protein